MTVMLVLLLSSLILLLWLRWPGRSGHGLEQEMELNKLRHQADKLRKERDAFFEDATRKRDELQIIYDVARSLGASTHLGEATLIVLSMIRRLHIPYQSCVQFLVQKDGGLEVALCDTAPGRTQPEFALGPLLQQVAREKKACLMGAAQLFSDEQSVLLVPLQVHKETVGLIYLGSVHPGTHRPEHLEKLKTLAAIAAPSIKTALLFGRQAEMLESERLTLVAMEAKNRQLGGLQSLGAAIGASLKLSDTLRAVADNLRQIIPTSQSVIFFVPQGNLLKVEYADSPYVDYLGRLSLRPVSLGGSEGGEPGEGLLGRADQSREALLVTDTRTCEGQGLIHKERCAIVAALRAEGQTLGFLYVGAVRENEFSEEHRQLVTTVAYQTAVAFNNARLYEQTQRLAETDGLTGLYLHRFFQVRLSEELARADQMNKSLCLVMVDTDHFKTYNDTLGHPAGDALLKDIAALLKDKVRHSDVVCRYGGDEFSIILNDVPKEEAARTCERIRESFQLRFATLAVQVTASIGVACYPSDASSKAELAQVADEALYVSKRGGRNRVSLAPPRS